VRGLKSDGFPQVIFAVIQCVASLLAVFLVAKALGMNVGSAAGLMAGSQTISAVLGVASDAINRMGASADEKKQLIDAMPVAYAVSYIFGTAGSAWVLATLGPKILRVDLPAECKNLEPQMGAGEVRDAGFIPAARRFDVRAYRLTSERLVNKTVADLEAVALAQDLRVFIERIRHDGQIVEAGPDSVVQPGDTVAVLARSDLLVQRGQNLGEGVDDRDLLEFPAQLLDIVITNKAIAGKTLRDLAESDIGRVTARGF